MDTVKNLRKEDGTWFWEFRGDKYRTNPEGEGVWRHELHALWQGWNQVEGTCDFYLRNMSLSGARKKLNRHFQKYY